MPEGYEDTRADTRLGDQDQARRRRGGPMEGLGASRESGRGGRGDREGLGPVQRRRPGRGRGTPRGRAAGQDNVERPRTDETATSAEGREQPVVEPAVEVTPDAVADAPDTTTTKVQTEDPTKLDSTGDKG
jgi:hypothetical protein